MLKNKIALITGAGRGIGRAIAIALAKEGAEVVINYNGSEERAKEVGMSAHRENTAHESREFYKRNTDRRSAGFLCGSWRGFPFWL